MRILFAFILGILVGHFGAELVVKKTAEVGAKSLEVGAKAIRTTSDVVK
jgi:hypothetical protein